MTVPQTIFVNHEPGTYKAYKTIGGWTIMFLDENNNSRPADGSKVYKHRQNAYARAKQLNERLPKTLSTILSKAQCADYDWDGYYVYVTDETVEGNGYSIAIAKEALPPYRTEYRGTIEEIEQFLDGTLGYTAGSKVWTAAEVEM